MRVSVRAALVAALVAGGVAGGVAGLGAPAVAAPAEGTVLGAGEQGAIRDRYIVVFKDGVDPTATAATASKLATRFGGKVRRAFSRSLSGFSAQLTERQAKRLAASPLVEYVQQDKTVRLADTQYSAPWGLDRIDQATRPLSGTYTYSTVAANVTAYVLDTGIRTTHSEFGGRARSGYDFVDNDTDASDCHGHGTHVAGTIGGSTYGVAKQAQLVAVRVLDCAGSGSYDGIIAGIDWVTANAQKPAVVNMSLGGGASVLLDQAVRSSIASGVTYVVAAGNSNVDACTVSPARTAEAITVGATDATDTRASFSNYGSCLDIFAPGVAITSAGKASDSATAVMSGTSMASPHVAGVAALYLATYPSASPAVVRDAVIGNGVTGLVTNAGAASPNRLLVTVGTPVPETAPAAPAAPVYVPCNLKTNGTNVTVRDRGQGTSAVAVTGCAGRAARATRVEVHVVTAKRGDLVVELIAPGGSVKRLKAANKRDKAANLNAVYTVNMSSKNKNGTWKLRVRDTVKGGAGYLDSWTLTV
ncbi:S8 family serine peptidase [Dactylosporangium sp. AC04546]|uniref:S8 family peptidase n=1 Tax=Dactylosporangium sp. AC04546 TaxID=2862460 RepID=UPI001EDE4BC3|nr:S8 family peptidase [Dactylosporangium sp. AC04546]WVK82697.1 S8 family serine peptidase [Dactylosporangium sp. AC04546]